MPGKSNNPRKILADIAKESKAEGDAARKSGSQPFKRKGMGDAKPDTKPLEGEDPEYDGLNSSELRSIFEIDSMELDKEFEAMGRRNDSQNTEPEDEIAKGALSHPLSESKDIGGISELTGSSSPHGAEEVRRRNVPEGKRQRHTPQNGKGAKKGPGRSKGRLIGIIAAVVLGAILIAAVVVFCIFRWGMGDDAQDFEGRWRITDSGAIVTIEDGKIHLTDEIAYSYEIDPFAKTLDFGFGKSNGSARYRFSADRDMLSIEDGEFDGLGNMVYDIPWTFESIIDSISGSEEKDPSLSDDSMTLERVG